MRVLLAVVLLPGCLLSGSEGASTDAGPEPIPDGGGGGFMCFDDSPFEPNDTIGNAFRTPVAGTANQFAIGAAICPPTDRDHYGLDVVTSNSNIVLTTNWASGVPVNVSLLNAGGTAIANATSDTPTSMKICVPNLPLGTYFASVFASEQNNYTVTIMLVPDCMSD